MATHQKFFDPRESICEFKWQFKGFKDTEIIFSCQTHRHGDSIDEARGDTPSPSLRGTYIPDDTYFSEYVIRGDTHIFLFHSRMNKLFWFDVRIKKGGL